MKDAERRDGFMSCLRNLSVVKGPQENKDH